MCVSSDISGLLLMTTTTSSTMPLTAHCRSLLLRWLWSVQNNPSVKHVTVLGGGFVGCEVALALAERGRATGMVVNQARTSQSQHATTRQALGVFTTLCFFMMAAVVTLVALCRN